MYWVKVQIVLQNCERVNIEQFQSSVTGTNDRDTTTKLALFVAQAVPSGKQQKYLIKLTVNIAISARICALVAYHGTLDA